VISKILFSKSKNKKRIIFLDRDGVINIKPKEHDYVKSWSEFIFSPKIIDLLTLLKTKYQFIIISNQQGIAKKLMTENNFEDISNKMVKELKKNSIDISAIYYCPHHVNDNCMCRKPKPGLILSALSDYSVSPELCALIGDSEQDIEAGKRSGIKYNYLLSSNKITKEDFNKITNDLK